MPAAEPAPAAGVARDGDCLRFHGPLQRGAVASLWKAALPLVDGVRRIDLAAVSAVDSAGIALLAELASRSGADARVEGSPAGLAELRGAYRLGPGLAFAH